MRICYVTSELTPLAKTGGLADVASGLAGYLGRQGHDVRLFMPLYPRIRDGGWPLEDSVAQQDAASTFGARTFSYDVRTTPLPGPGAEPAGKGGAWVYLVDCPALYDGEELYTDDALEPIRFALLCRAALDGCQRMQWRPDVIHCNDWHTGLLPLYLRTTYAWDRVFADTHTLLTIHNIGYQGVFGAERLEDLGLMGERRHLDGGDLMGGIVNFLKTGLLHADALTTVSRRYAEEIQTPEFGSGLEEVLRARRDVLSGIVNGVDYAQWDPATDGLLWHRYSAQKMGGKAKNKAALLAEFGLAPDPDGPVFGIVSRLTSQKGFDLLPDVMPILLQQADVRLVALGSGDADIERYFQWLRDTYPEKVAVYRGYHDELAHRIEAGADVFLMPSRYEPCGLNQMYSLRYGTAPLVRRVGGLADTVREFDPETGEGTGFLFDGFTAGELYEALRRVLAVWAEPDAWARMVRNGMAEDYSWDRQGQEYEALYRRLRAMGPEA